MLKCRGITKTYSGANSGIEVLCGLDADFEAGAIHAVVGPSGCGKSTYLLICGALLQPDAGDVWLGEVQLFQGSSAQQARRRPSLIGYVFQQFHLVPYLNVQENILVASMATQHSQEQIQQRCEDLMERLGLKHRHHHLPSKLSVGEQQRVALARALLNQPKMIIADEPTGNLDRENSQVVMAILREYTLAGGCVLLATHDHEIANQADTRQLIEAGKLCRLTGEF